MRSRRDTREGEFPWWHVFYHIKETKNGVVLFFRACSHDQCNFALAQQAMTAKQQRPPKLPSSLPSGPKGKRTEASQQQSPLL